MGTWRNNIVTRAVKNWQFEKAKLPQEIANIGQNYFTGSFKTRSWGMNAWKDRKDKRNKRALLVKTGALRRNVSRSTRIANMRMIKWGVYLPYARVHNEGLGNMPKRQFMGINSFLLNKINKRMKLRMRQIFR